MFNHFKKMFHRESPSNRCTLRHFFSFFSLVDQISKIDCDFEDASSCGYTAESSHSGVSFVRQTGMSASRLSSTSNGITSSSQG
jgi:hypothetical protein